MFIFTKELNQCHFTFRTFHALFSEKKGNKYEISNKNAFYHNRSPSRISQASLSMNEHAEI